MSNAENDLIEAEQRYRASAWALLAALLRATPDQALLNHVGTLSPDGDEELDELDELGRAMAALAGAALDKNPAQLEEEYNELFIGIGRGEVVPYGSWYLTGFLMEKPLSDLRDDLRALGFERNENVREPEDHAGAIFEVFSVMILEGFGPQQQQVFFKNHMQPWLERFFDDLVKARSADFYKHVAQFGAALLQLEAAYLSMRS